MLWYRLQAIAALLGSCALWYGMIWWADDYAIDYAIMSPGVSSIEKFILAIVLLVGTVVLFLLGWVFGVGGLVASFGTESDGKGYFKFRDNWVARWFLPQPRPGESWCSVSADASGKFGLKLLVSIVSVAAILLGGALAYEYTADFFWWVAIVLSVILGAISFAYGVEEKEPAALLVTAIIVVGWALYGLSFVPWQEIYQTALRMSPHVPELAMHPLSKMLGAVALGAIVVALFLRIDAVHERVCPMMRIQPAELPKAAESSKPAASPDEQSTSA